jgi:hypothetical protein
MQWTNALAYLPAASMTKKKKKFYEIAERKVGAIQNFLKVAL